MKSLLTLLFFILTFQVCLKIEGQQLKIEDSTKLFKHSIGVGAGFTTGYGLSYRFMPNKLGVQVNFAPYHTTLIDRYSTGISFFYRLIESKTTNLFLYQGNHYYYSSETHYFMNSDLMEETYEITNHMTSKKDNYVNNGLGIGIEFIIVKRIGFDIMMGYAFYNTFTQVNFTGEAGLYYKF